MEIPIDPETGKQLGACLNNGRFIRFGLAEWLVWYAMSPDKGQMNVRELENGALAIELRDEEGRISGGTLFHTALGTLHVHNSADGRRYSESELREAFKIAAKREKEEEAACDDRRRMTNLFLAALLGFFGGIFFCQFLSP